MEKEGEEEQEGEGPSGAPRRLPGHSLATGEGRKVDPPPAPSESSAALGAYPASSPSRPSTLRQPCSCHPMSDQSSCSDTACFGRITLLPRVVAVVVALQTSNVAKISRRRFVAVLDFRGPSMRPRSVQNNSGRKTESKGSCRDFQGPRIESSSSRRRRTLVEGRVGGSRGSPGALGGSRRSTKRKKQTKNTSSGLRARGGVLLLPPRRGPAAPVQSRGGASENNPTGPRGGRRV